VRVEYRSTPDDYEHLLRVNWPRPTLHVGTYIVVALLMAGLVAFGFFASDPLLIITVTIVMIASLLITWPYYLREQYDTGVAQMARDYRPGDGVLFSVELAEHAVIAIDNDIRIEYPWHMIKRLEVVDRAILFHVVPHGVMQVMRHAFGSEQEETAFVERARALIDRHASRRPSTASEDGS